MNIMAYLKQSLAQPLSMNKYLPIAVLYFFFNSFMLPQGLLYTTILTPLFLIWLLKYPTFHYIWFFFLFTIPFAIILYMHGIHLLFYFRSYALLFTWFVFGIAFYQFLKNCR